MQEKDKILYLESLRGIAALVVAIYHLDSGSIFNNPFTKNGWLMVDFFFILSGFVIALNYQNKIKSLANVYNFQARRFLRLYPLHILTLFVWLGIESAKYVAEVRFGLVANNAAFSTNDFASFVQNIFLLQNLLSDTLTWNRPGWSISAEFYTYIVFALIVLATRGSKLVISALAFVISVAAFMFLVRNSMAPEHGFVRCLFSFFMGVLALNFCNAFKIKVPSFVSYLLMILAIYLVCISNGEYSIGINIFIPFCFLFLLLSLILSPDDNFLKRMLDNSYLVYLGTISYGIYMIHTALWWAATQTFRFVFEFETTVNAEGATELVFNSTLISNAVMVVGLALLIFLAHLSYKFIEMPVNDFRHRLGRFQ